MIDVLVQNLSVSSTYPTTIDVLVQNLSVSSTYPTAIGL